MNRPELTVLINIYELTELSHMLSSFLNIRKRRISVLKYSLLLIWFLLSNVNCSSTNTACHQAAH